jgi:hydrogenase-4 component B
MGSLLPLSLSILALAAVAGLFLPNDPNRLAVGWLTALGAALAGVLGVWALFAGEVTWWLPNVLPASGLVLQLDRLAGFFLVLVSLGVVPAAIYGVGYTKELERRGGLRHVGVMLPLFVACMLLVPLAANGITFLVAWEGMSITSYFLVMTENRSASVREAGLWYAVMTHMGLGFLLGAFFVFGEAAGSLAFADLRSAAPDLALGMRNAIFLLAFLGFGSKAGMVPLHVWLPRAHPAAPSHVSALMSGVMLKLGIYGLLRIAVDLLGNGPAWWGALLLVVGAASALLGILYALMEHDLKRLLAYSSVENIGIILLGLGAALIFRTHNLPVLALLGLTAALYHTLNHTAFKSLLFLGAGAVLHATGTRNMERMGGLLKRMPWTGLFFLVGATAISALPPLNGFMSEWLTFQVLLQGFQIPSPGLVMLLPLAMGALALTGGLAAACFVKAFGISFLALPRSTEAEKAHEASPSMLGGMALLVLVCLVLGLGATWVIPALLMVASSTSGLAAPPDLVRTNGVMLGMPADFARISPLLIAALLLGLAALLPLFLRLLRTDFRLRLSDTWGCGRINPTPRQEYTASSFAEPLKRVFASLYRPSRDLSIDFHPNSIYFRESISYRSEIRPWFDHYLYLPFLQTVMWIATRTRRIQAGSIHLYLAYIVVTLLILLWVARV